MSLSNTAKATYTLRHRRSSVEENTKTVKGKQSIIKYAGTLRRPTKRNRRVRRSRSAHHGRARQQLLAVEKVTTSGAEETKRRQERRKFKKSGEEGYQKDLPRHAQQ
jgi:hypothetical protein